MVTAVLLAASLLAGRGIVALRRHWLGVPHQYPPSWTASDIEVLGRFRAAIGFALMLTWGWLLVSWTHLPGSGPLNLLQALFTIILLLLTSAWVRLVIPGRWNRALNRIKFARVFGCLVALWLVLLGGSLFAIAKSAAAMAARPVHIVAGTYA